jgi:hypothetical protein
MKTVYSVENLGHYLRVVADSDGEFGDDIIGIGDCRIPQNWETARLIAQDLNEIPYSSLE